MATGQPTKVCSKCRAEKPVEAFGIESRQKDGRRAHCLACGNIYARAFRATNPAPKAWLKSPAGRNCRRRAKLRSKYGLSESDFTALLAAQGGRCSICRTDCPADRWNTFHVDHCHTTGRIRGLLCASCNKGLGHFRDNPDLLKRAADYLSG